MISNNSGVAMVFATKGSIDNKNKGVNRNYPGYNFSSFGTNNSITFHHPISTLNFDVCFNRGSDQRKRERERSKTRRIVLTLKLSS